MRRRGVAGLLLALTVAGVGIASGISWAEAPATRSRGPAKATAPPSIEWREWSREAFDEAAAKRKLVLLDVTAFWCHWCRVMAEESYADSAVVAEIRANFIPIRVDYDLRPDIGDRYLTNGWPTTGILSANGHLLLAKTYLPPSGLRDFLKEAVRFYRVNRQQVDRKVAEAEKAVARTWEPDSLLPPSLSEEEYIERNIAALRDSEDKVHGGFGTAPKTARWDAISFLLRAADAHRDDDLRALAVRATAAALALQDSVDGGFFRFALEPDWTRPRYERLLDEQAAALSILARVHRATGERRFDEAAQRLERFTTGLRNGGRPGSGAPQPHTWRLAVAPDVRLRDGSWLEGDVYFRLSRAARLKQGEPARSPTCVTDAAARMVSARIERHGRKGPADLSPLQQIWETMNRGDGGLFHAERGRDRFGDGLLADQAAVGNALLDAYGTSGSRSWLARADSVAAWLRANLEDPVGGGFRYAPLDRAAMGRVRAGDKPERANVEAAIFFLRRHWLTGRREDRDVAERTSRYLQSGEKIVLDPARAELALRLRQEPVRLLVIGSNDSKNRALGGRLRLAALNAPTPEVVVAYLDSPRDGKSGIAWPDGPPQDAVSPAIYRWTATGWRGPVTDPAMLEEILDKPAVEP